MKMLTIHPLDRHHEIRPSRLASLRRIPTVVLGSVLSVIAVVVAIVVSSTTAVSDLVLVVATLSVGFVASWFNSALPTRR